MNGYGQVSHPLLVARTRLQVQGSFGRPIEYTGMVDCLMKTYRTGGWRALMGGWGPSMGKNVPAIAIQFAACEKTLQFIKGQGWFNPGFI